MKIKITIIVLLLLNACFQINRRHVNERNCNIVEAAQKANKIMGVEGFQLKLLKRRVEEKDTAYFFFYTTKDLTIRNHKRAEIVISKTNCKVIEKHFHQ